MAKRKGLIQKLSGRVHGEGAGEEQNADQNVRGEKKQGL